MTDKQQEGGGAPSFTARECEIIERLVDGKTHSRIAREMGFSVGYIHFAVKAAAVKVPGKGRPSFRLTRWYWYIAGGSTSSLMPHDGSDTAAL